MSNPVHVHLSRRIQAFEFNDLERAPRALRDTIVEALGRTLEWGQMMRGLIPHVARFYSESKVEQVLDLGAGAGRPALILSEALKQEGIRPPKIWLTDLYPQPQLWARIKAESGGFIDLIEQPVDATSIPEPLGHRRARQLINVLHHLPEPLVREVLGDAIAARSPLFIAEAFRREPLQFLNFAPAGLPALWLNPLLTDRDRLQKAFLTWLTPIALAASLWDGFISTMRIHEPEELLALARTCPGYEAYSWHHGSYGYPPRGTGFYLYGVPRSRAR